ncbi:hypothetical protein BDN67DRAFT_1012953 [Paxillus ammoniavirescens]|nr:hypothetical protein BDN67DRAFT_1012953 [Paxillus ammoniavirescens]
MHRCLGIVEVQRAIFLEVYQQPASEDRATLARLSRTCRAFNSSALDVLWATLESFTVLVQCLPRDLWKIDVAEKQLCLCRPMSLKDWEIFYKYSTRVRCVLRSIGPERSTAYTNLGDDIIFALSNPPTYKPLIPYLKELYWDRPDKKYASLLRSLLTPSLDKLSLWTFSYSLGSPDISILTSVGAITPSVVFFAVEEPPTMNAIRLFFQVLANACGSDRLAQIALCVSSNRRALPQPEQVTLSTFQSLLALPNVTWFQLDVPCAILLDDADLTTLAKHWPILKRLSINTQRGWGASNRITHQGLLNLLSHCPELSGFALSVDFSDIDIDTSRLSDSRPGNGVTHERCTTADFVTSTINNPIAIAAFLSDIFPKLSYVHHSWGDNPTISGEATEDMEIYRQRWEEVKGLVPAFAAVRRQCLQWYREDTMSA